MVTRTDREVLPPLPLQVSVKVLSVFSAATVSDPVGALMPDQSPDALQEVACSLDQFNVVEPLVGTLVGDAERFTTGGVVGAPIAEACAPSVLGSPISRHAVNSEELITMAASRTSFETFTNSTAFTFATSRQIMSA